MRLLDWIRQKVSKLNSIELWLFIACRVFVAFGLGILAMTYFPRLANPAAIPCIVLGFIMLAIAFKGFVRKDPPEPK
jgi:hypothetical protein